MLAALSPTTSDLWAITSYFNPQSYRRRLQNYRCFRQHLPLPLLTVELSFGQPFELQPGDAEVLLQFTHGAVLWQKERLLNVAVQQLPPACRAVVWIDGDLLIGAADRFHHVAFTYGLQMGRPFLESLRASAHRAPGSSTLGFAWAARRDWLQRHGLYDACLVGGGDTAFLCALHGCFTEVCARHEMTHHQRQHYLAWAEPVYHSIRGETTHVDTPLFHLWHGDLTHRRSRTRHQALAAFDFDPNTDVKLSAEQTWLWNTPKPRMHQCVREYFAARREDG